MHLDEFSLSANFHRPPKLNTKSWCNLLTYVTHSTNYYSHETQLNADTSNKQLNTEGAQRSLVLFLYRRSDYQSRKFEFRLSCSPFENLLFSIVQRRFSSDCCITTKYNYTTRPNAVALYSTNLTYANVHTYIPELIIYSAKYKECPKRARQRERSGKRRSGRPRLRWEDSLKRDPEKVDVNSHRWVAIAEERGTWTELTGTA